MRSYLELKTAAAVVAISTANAKSHLRVTHSDEDTLIDTYIAAATEWLEARTSRSLINTTWLEYFSGLPASQADPLRLTMAPLSSVSSIKYYDSDDVQQTWSSDDYDVHTPTHLSGRVTVTPGYTWPVYRTDRAYPIEVEYVAGYGAAASAIPDTNLHALKLIVDHYYRCRGVSEDPSSNALVAWALTRLATEHATGVYP